MENKTSHIVEKGSEFVVTAKEYAAIAEKYKRMEEALKKISEDNVTLCERCADFETGERIFIAKVALAFDPLA